MSALRCWAGAALLVLLPAIGSSSWACSCFSPELRAKTAKETLEMSRVAVFARVTAISDADVTLEVLESYKGPAIGVALVIARKPDDCPTQTAAVGEEFLFLAFGAEPSLCGKYPSDNFLLGEFRTLKPRSLAP